MKTGGQVEKKLDKISIELEFIYEDTLGIFLVKDTKRIGHISIEYIDCGFYEFENQLTEDAYDEMFPDDNLIKVNTIAIDRGERGNGYSKLLMKEAFKHFKHYKFII
jgi:GNAT superfamily N-acetyltransferase